MKSTKANYRGGVVAHAVPATATAATGSSRRQPTPFSNEDLAKNPNLTVLHTAEAVPIPPPS